MDAIGELYTQAPMHSDTDTGARAMNSKKKTKSKKMDEKMHGDRIKLSSLASSKIKNPAKFNPFEANSDDDALNQIAISATRPPDIESYAR